MIADTSALLAVVFGEPDAQTYASALERGPVTVSAAVVVEATIVAEARQGIYASRDLQLLISTVNAVILPVDAVQAEQATGAWRRFGKGRHPAGLNLGDCFAYAAAHCLGEPLLFKGNDFAQTDVRSALG